VRQVLIDHGWTDQEARQEELDTLGNADGEGWFLTVEELAPGCAGAAQEVLDELRRELARVVVND